MEFPIKFDTATCKSGWSIVNIAGSHVIFLSVKTMRHFIWVFTVCHSTYLGVYGLQGLSQTTDHSSLPLQREMNVKLKRTVNFQISIVRHALKFMMIYN